MYACRLRRSTPLVLWDVICVCMHIFLSGSSVLGSPRAGWLAGLLDGWLELEPHVSCMRAAIGTYVMCMCM